MTSDVFHAEWELPLISCIMPTYGRPQYVHESVKMFLDQDYPAKELVILNDCAGQVFHCELPNVRVFNTSQRFSSLGEKRNECIKMSRGELVAIWDDDDVYLPWRLSYSMSELQRWDTEFYRPAEFLAYWGEDFLHDNQVVPGWLSHPTALLRKSLWERVGGYPARDTGEDSEFFDRIHRHLGQEFIKYPMAQSDRFMILRGKSQYQHMSIGGGQGPLEIQPGDYHIIPRSIADRQLRTMVNRLRRDRQHYSPILPVRSTVENDAALLPLLSVCISIKNRSRVAYGEQELELFPNCVRWLKAASETVGPMELVVADFQSDDWPLVEWLHQEATASFQIRVVTVDGRFSRGRGLNMAARHATASRLFFCDADILVGPEALLRGLAALNVGKAAFPICLCVNHDGTPAFWQSLGAGLAFVDKALWEAVNGIPEFTSWGGEDDLFRLAVLRQVEEHRECDSALRHQWHPDACRHEHYIRAAQSDFQSTIETGALNPRQTETRHTKTVKVFRGEHACWAGDVREVHLYASGRMERPGIDFGTYELREGDQIVLKWDHWPAEILTWDESSRVYRDRSKSFTLSEIPTALRVQEQ